MVRTARSSIFFWSASSSASMVDDALAERDVAADQRVDGIDDHALGDAAHLGDQARELLEVGVEGLCGMFRTHVPSPQPNRPVM